MKKKIKKKIKKIKIWLSWAGAPIPEVEYPPTYP